MQATGVQARPVATVGGRRTATRAASSNGARPVAALEAGSRIRVTAPVKVRGSWAGEQLGPLPAERVGCRLPLRWRRCGRPSHVLSPLNFILLVPSTTSDWFALAAATLQVYHVAKFKEGLDLQGREATVLKPDVSRQLSCIGDSTVL